MPPLQLCLCVCVYVCVCVCVCVCVRIQFSHAAKSILLAREAYQVNLFIQAKSMRANLPAPADLNRLVLSPVIHVSVSEGVCKLF